MNDNIFIPGLLIAIQQFPHVPPESLQAKYRSFWTALFSITRHNTQAPTWSRLVGQKSLSLGIFKSQTTLVSWFLKLSNSPSWSHVGKFMKEPKHWGPYMWSLIHGVARLVRPTDGLYFGEWLCLIPAILPCRTCADSFTQILSTTPGVKQGRDPKLLALLLHNKVNSEIPGSRKIQIHDTDRILNEKSVTQIPIPKTPPPILKKKAVVSWKSTRYAIPHKKKAGSPPPKKRRGCGCGGK